jgi:uncharacterized repeat protein (TIGR01451 family)
MNSKKTVFQFALALCLATAGMAMLLGFLGGVQGQVHAADLQSVSHPVDGGRAARLSPRLDPLPEAVYAPVDSPPAAPLGGIVDTSAVITVCSSGCDYTTVQAAVDAASDGDTIKVAQGTYIDNDADNYVVEISKSLTIQGGYSVSDWAIPNPDGNPTILDGGNSDQVVRIAAGNPTIEGFRIWRGNAVQGAGVYIAGGSPVVRRNRIYGNGTAGSSGGGVYVADGSPVLENNLIYGNTATDGGGVYVAAGSAAMRYNTFYNNTASDGAGLYLASGTPVVSASIVVSNTASGSGGGIYGVGMPDSRILYNDVFGNTPKNFAGFSDDDVLPDNLSENPRLVNPAGANFRLRADSPCIGMFGAEYPTAGPIDDYDGYSRPFGEYWDIGAHEFYAGACFARVESGRVYTTVQEAVGDSSAGAELRVAGRCTGSGSEVVNLSQALTLRGGYTLTNWVESQPVPHATVLDGEGARRVIYVGDVAVTVEGLDIYNGYVSDQNGGGIYLKEYSSSVIRYNRVFSNGATLRGGGLYIQGGVHTVQDNEIYSNTSGTGGGVYIDATRRSDVVIEDNQIHHNYAASGGGIGVGNDSPNQGLAEIRGNEIYANQLTAAGSGHQGGGIYCGPGSASVIQGNVIYSNTAQSGGGIGSFTNDSATVEGNQIYGNTATGSGGGGGLCVGSASVPDAVMLARNNDIFGNVATSGRGAGVYARSAGGNIIVEGNRVYANTGASSGGGIHLMGADAVVRNNLIYTNTGLAGGGCSIDSNALLANNTIYNNRATNTVNGGGVHRVGDAFVRNNIIVDNIGWGILGNFGANSSYNDVYSNTSGECSGTPSACDPAYGNISASPQFEDPLAADFHLQTTSPCRDAVITSTVYSEYDFEHYACPFGKYWDIGAHEYYTGTCFARLSTGGGVYTNVQAAVISATAGVSDVLVAGVCDGDDGAVTIDKSMALHGGYAKSDWTEPTTYTILNAAGHSHVVTITGASNMTVTVGELVVRGASGAAIYVAASLSPTIQNIVAHDNGAGFALTSGGNPRLYNNTFVYNAGAGISLNGSGAPIISNTIVVSNTGAGIAATGNVPILAYNDVWGNGTNYNGVGAGATDISQNPRFVDPAGDDFHLRADSPCIHAGDRGTGVEIDFEGHARPDGTGQGRRYDIGADEATDYYGVDLAPDYLEQVKPPGSSVEYVHYVTNTGTHDGAFSITCTLTVEDGGGATWADPVCPTDYYLVVDESAEVPVALDVPGSEISGTRAIVFLTATHEADGLYFVDVASNTTFVQSDWGVILTPETAQQTVDPGQGVVYVHTLENQGGADVFTLTLDSSPWPAQVVPPGPVIVGGSNSIEVSIQFTVPITASDEAVQTMVLMATSAGAAQAGKLVMDVATDTTYINDTYGDRYVATWGNDNVYGAAGLNSCRVYTYPCRTIGQALDQAKGGETIKVEQGTYSENKLELNDPVVLRGGYTKDDNWTTYDFARSTVIDAYNANPDLRGRVLYIAGNPVVEGFTLQNGLNTGYGGGVYVAQGASPVLRHNIIRDNEARSGGGVLGQGGGVYNAGGSPTLDGNVLRDNTAAGFGGGFYNNKGVANIWNNVFRGNDSPSGGGFYNEAGNTRVWHNTVISNTADFGAGLYLAGGSPVVSSTIAVYNVADNDGGGVFRASGVVGHNDVWNNTPNDYSGIARPGTDINADPLFVDTVGWDYHLLRASPCRDQGDRAVLSLLTNDLDGQPRAMNLEPPVPDIGADEYQRPDVALSQGVSLPGARGSWVTYTHRLTNTGNYNDFYLLTWQGEWEVMVEGSAAQPITTPVLSSGEMMMVEVMVRVPEDVLSGTARMTIVTATSQVAVSQGETDIYDTAEDTTIAGLDVDVSLVEDLDGWADGGESVVYRHTLVNTGNYTDLFDLTFENYAPTPWDAVLLSPATPVELGMGESVTVSLMVTVPFGATRLEVCNTLVTATSQADVGVFAVVTDTTVAYRMVGIGLAADSALSGDSGTWVEHQHVLTNSGNYTDTYVFTYTSERDWDVEIGVQGGPYDTPPVWIEIGMWDQSTTPTPVTKNVVVRVFIPDPPEAFGGWHNTMVVTATSVATSALTASVTDVTTVTKKEGIELWYNYNQLYQQSGRNRLVRRMVVTGLSQDVVFTHTVYNTNHPSNITDTVTMDIASMPDWSPIVSPTLIEDLGWNTLFTNVLATLTVLPEPEHPVVAPAATAWVTANSEFYPYPPDGQANVTNTVIVNQWVDVAWSPDGLLHAPPPGPYFYTRTLNNTGNYTDSYTLSGSSSWGGSTSFLEWSPIPNIGPAASRVVTMQVATVPFWPCYDVGTVTINAASRTPQAGTAGYTPTDSLVDTFQVDPVYYVDMTPAFANPVGTGLPRKLHYLSTDTAQIQETYVRGVTNTGNCSNTFDIDVTTADFTPLDFEPTSTGVLSPSTWWPSGGSMPVAITITLPQSDCVDPGNLVTGTVVFTADGQYAGDSDSVTDIVVVNQHVGTVFEMDETETITEPGTVDVIYIHVLTNTGNYEDVFELTWQNEPWSNPDVYVQVGGSGNWSNQQGVRAPRTGVLDPGESIPINVRIRVPADVYTITNRTWLTATSFTWKEVGDGIVVDSAAAVVTDTTHVRRPHVTLVPDMDTQDVTHGNPYTYVHVLQNDGGLTGTYTITYASSHGWVQNLTPTTVNDLLPGDALTITVTGAVPLGTFYTEYDVTVITATYTLPYTVLVLDTATDTTRVPRNVNAALTPDYYDHVTAGTAISHSHTLTNTGSYTETFRLSVDANLNVTIEPAPPSLIEDLPPGGSVMVTVSLAVPAYAPGGYTDTVEINVIHDDEKGWVTSAVDSVYISPTVGTRFVDLNQGDDEFNNCTMRDGRAPCLTIQHAVDQAAAGDTVKVAYGTYVDVLDADQVVWVNKPITLTGGYLFGDWEVSDPVARPTVLDAQGERQVVVVAAGVDPIIEGFHLRNGYADGSGAGLFITAGATPTVRSNYIHDNVATGCGGGVYHGGGDAVLDRNAIYDNQANSGGGVCLWGGETQVMNNLVHGNEVTLYGGGLYNQYGVPLIWNNTFYSNAALSGDGLYGAAGTLVISNTIVANNAGQGIRRAPAASVTLAYNDVWGNGDDYSNLDPGVSDISVDPLFQDPLGGDLHLTFDSPCINVGAPGVSQPEKDHEGNSRPLFGRYDIGAYEYSITSTKSVAGVFEPGETITYVVQVTNAGAVAHTILMTDTLHEFLDATGFLFYTTGLGNYPLSAGATISWTGVVSGNTTDFITFTAHITDIAGAYVPITNVAWVDYGQTTVVELNVVPESGTRYVTPDGYDRLHDNPDRDNNCQQISAPCVTVQHAVDEALPGDEVKVAAGIYTDTDGLGQVVDVSKAITLTGGYAPPQWSVFDPNENETVLQGQSGDVVVIGPAAVTLAGFHIVSGTAGVNVSGSGDVALSRSWVRDNVDGVNVASGGGYELVNNIIADNTGDGLQTAGTSVGTAIHNTFARNDYGARIGGTAYFTNTIFYGHAVGVNATGSAYLSHSLWDGNTTNYSGNYDIGSANVYSDPLFVDLSLPDYHIQETSAAVDQGIVVPGLSDEGVDIDGEARWVKDAPDLGADEFPSGLYKFGPEFAAPGQTTPYTVVLEAKEAGLVVTDVIPSHVTYVTGSVACTVDTCAYVPGANAVVWTGTSTEVVTITYQAQFDPWLGKGVIIESYAQLKRAGFSRVEKSPVWRTEILQVPGARHVTVAPTGVDVDAGTDNNCLVDWKPCQTIQWAIGQAMDGDTVRVAAGTFTDTDAEVVYVNKAITLTGGYTTTGWERDVDAYPTYLDGQGIRRVMYIADTAGPATVDGFHLHNGYVLGGYGGGGLLVNGSAVKLIRNRIYSNTASGAAGGGIRLANAEATLIGNQIYENTSGGYGGGMFAQSSGVNLSMINNIVVANQASYGGDGLALDGSTSAQALLYHNTIADNAEQGVFIGRFTLMMTNTIVAGHTEYGVNRSSNGVAVANYTLWHNNVDNWSSGVTDNNPKSGDPRFRDPTAPGWDYHIQPNSAAFDIAVDTSVTIDVDDEARPMGLGPDVGADELRVTLDVVKEADPYPMAQPGELLTYTIRVTNTGLLTLTMTVVDDLPAAVIPSGTWVTTTGEVVPGDFREFVIQVQTQFAGTLTNVVTATADRGATDTYVLTSTVGGEPDIAVTPLALSALLAPNGTVNRTLTIANNGTANLNWSLTEIPTDVGWLGESAASGTVPPLGGSEDVVVGFNAASLTDNIYNTTLRVTSDDPTSPTIDVGVVLTVCTPVAGASFTYTPVAPELDQVIHFTGSVTAGTGVVYTWDLGDGTNASGQFVAHAYPISDTYTVVMTATNCYGASVVPYSEDVVVVGVPRITATPSPLSVILAPDATTTRTLTIGNVAGTMALSWSLAETPADVGWLSESLTSGSVLPAGSTQVVVSFNAAGLSEAAYNTTLQITSNDPDDSPLNVPVTLTVSTGVNEIYLPLVLRNL